MYHISMAKENRMNRWGLLTRFSDELVLKDMENVMRAVEFIFVSMKKHTPAPLKRGVRRARKTFVLILKQLFIF
jgi:hypothetical protein